MSKKNDKGRLPPFTPLLHATLDAPAWRAMSYGAGWLYVALKRRANSGPRAYISYRDAIAVLACSRGKLREWFAELEHYGFIRLHAHGCLGTEGKGKAPHWRLTEKGQTSKASPEGLFEPPPNDFLKWDGTLFDPKPYRESHNKGRRTWTDDKIKKQNPVSYVGNTPFPTSGTPPVPTSEPPQAESGSYVRAIGTDETVSYVRAISSLTTIGESPAEAPASPAPPLPPPDSASIKGENNLVFLDDRLATLLAPEKRRKRKCP
jgi:hypothetical protein